MSTAEPARKRQLAVDEDELTSQECGQEADADGLLHQLTNKRWKVVNNDNNEGNVSEHIDQPEDSLQEGIAQAIMNDDEKAAVKLVKFINSCWLIKMEFCEKLDSSLTSG